MFSDVLQRAYNINKEYLKEEGINSWQEWLQKDTPREIAMVVESDSTIYQRYLMLLPDGTYFQDVIEAYKSGQLEEVTTKPSITPIQIEQTNAQPTQPWQPQQKQTVDPQTAKKIYDIARMRRSQSNSAEVDEARKKLFLIFNTDPQLPEKLGVSKSELNKYIKYISGLSVQSKRIQDQLNSGVPEEHQWVGIYNSTFMGRNKVTPEELDQFVKGIEVTNEGKYFYGSQRGDVFRRYVAQSFLAIDTHLEYTDLNLKIGKCQGTEHRSPRGQYVPWKKMIVVDDVNENTVAHELGHYLDYKFGEQFMHENTTLSQVGNYTISNAIPEKQRQWAISFRTFTNQLMDKSDISSEYTQRASEVFARFVAKFVAWTQHKAGSSRYTGNTDDSTYNDRFTEQDYRLFVRLLQEKSYLDAKFPISPEMAGQR